MKKIKDIVYNIESVSRGTWLRLVFMLLSLSNIVLQSAGIKAIPIESEAINAGLTILLAAASGFAAYWKNNSFTSAAKAADKALRLFEEELAEN